MTTNTWQSLSKADLDDLVRLWRTSGEDASSELARRSAAAEIWRRCAQTIEAMARRMATSSPDRREQAKDLEQAGLVAAWEALQGYDPDRGASLQAHLTFHAKHAMGRCMAASGAIRVSEHGVDLIRARERVTRELMQALGRPPSVDEIARGMRERGSTTTEESMRKTLQYARGAVLSSDAPEIAGAADAAAFERWSSNRPAGDPLPDVLRVERGRVIRMALDALDRPDFELLIHRYFKETPLYDMAAQLCISVAAVKMRLVRARRRFVELLPEDFREPLIPSSVTMEEGLGGLHARRT